MNRNAPMWEILGTMAEALTRTENLAEAALDAVAHPHRGSDSMTLDVLRTREMLLVATLERIRTTCAEAVAESARLSTAPPA